TSILEYRLRDASNTQTILSDWSIGAQKLIPGTQTVELLVPANKAWYLIDLRSNADNSNIVSTANKVGAGEIIAVLGQSLAVDFIAAVNNDGNMVTLGSLGISPSPFSAVFATWHTDSLQNDPPAWRQPAD